eukprot:scaffold1947_cov207-Prasinococcus_capsulatus_cf.AAC.27
MVRSVLPGSCGECGLGSRIWSALLAALEWRLPSSGDQLLRQRCGGQSAPMVAATRIRGGYAVVQPLNCQLLPVGAEG